MRVRRGIAAGSLALTLVMLFSGSALGASHQPDGWVRFQGYYSDFSGTVDSHSAWIGQDIYNSTAVDQKAKHGAIGHFTKDWYFIFKITIENDGAPDRFTVKGGADAKYFRDDTDVPASVKAGTFTTRMLGGGGTANITVRLSAQGAKTKVTITSVADPTKVDAVKAVLTVG